MSDIPALLRLLHDDNPNRRHDACEELRVTPSIPEEAIAALQKATHDYNADVADAAKRALAIHQASPPAKQSVVAISTPVFISPPMPTSAPNTPEYIFALERRLMSADVDIRRLSDALQQATDQSSNVLSKLPNTAIISTSFLTRAFAVWGHLFVAQLIIAILIFFIVFLIGG
jgi:hypothetical protein